jgi:tRNA(Ile)-lysidine synthase
VIQLRATPTERRRLLQPLWNALESHVDVANGALLAVSGGPDSRALLESVARWPRRFDGEIHVASVDHGTRRESAAEADAVVARARVLGFAGVVLHVDGAGRSEAPLREARYTALFGYARAQSLAAVVVAHHEGDVAENALLSWLGQGGGALARPGVVRPFVALSRADMRLALAACGVDGAFADPDAVSARSRLRRSLLAPLSTSRGDVEARIARASSLAHDDDEALRAVAAALVVREGDRWRIERPEPARLPILRRALRLAVAAAGSPDPRGSSAAVEIAARLMRDKRAGHVDCAGCFVDVGADGNANLTARVADGRPATHDGRAGPRLSAARPMRMVRE